MNAGERVVYLPKKLVGTVGKVTTRRLRSGRRVPLIVVRLDVPEPKHLGGRLTCGPGQLMAVNEYEGRFDARMED